MERIKAISPLDGRYSGKTEVLSQYFSEEALINFRIIVECEYFIFLIEELSNKKKRIKKLTQNQKEAIRAIYKDRIQNALLVKKIEFSGYKNIPATNHDVKAIEYFLRQSFSKIGLSDKMEFLHFALTSEDINNIAYSLMIAMSIKKEILIEAQNIISILKNYAIKYAGCPLLARTHGQSAVGTTFGKEFRIFRERAKRQIEAIKNARINIKLNGAVGNYNAHYASYPDIDWIQFSFKFTRHLNKIFNLNLTTNLHTTQIESHDSWIEIFDRFRHLNSIFVNLSQDIWLYISDDLIKQKSNDGEIGSSTMPHKVNPIDFENAEGNLLLANSLFSFFASKLPISRLQRDLSDSTVERNIGSAFAYSIIGYKSLLNGLGKIEVNEKKSREYLEENIQIYSEGIQTILRREGIKNPYELLKKITRGKKISKSKLLFFINSLKVSKKVKDELIALLGKPYIGISEKLAKYRL
jgi:adenylosuccinate lyase